MSADTVNALPDLSDDVSDTANVGAGIASQSTAVTVDKIEVPKDIDIVQIACGSGYQLFLLSDGDVYARGKTTHGSLGVGDFNGRFGYVRTNIPEPVKMIGDCVAVTEDNDIYIWGIQYIEDEEIRDKNPQPGRYNPEGNFMYVTTPQKIEFGKSVKKIYHSDHYTNILTEDGEVYTFGYTVQELYEIIRFAGDYYPTQNPKLVRFPEKIVDLSSGYKHSLALGESGTLYGYGVLEHDQLGWEAQRADDYVVVTDKFNAGVIATCRLASFFVDKDQPTVLYGMGCLVEDMAETYGLDGDFARFELPAEIVEIFTSSGDSGNSIVIKCGDGNLYGFGPFYQGFYNLDRGTQQPTLVESDIEISEVVRYVETIYVKDVEGDFYRYDMPTKSSVKVSLNEDDIVE